LRISFFGCYQSQNFCFSFTQANRLKVLYEGRLDLLIATDDAISSDTYLSGDRSSFMQMPEKYFELAKSRAERWRGANPVSARRRLRQRLTDNWRLKPQLYNQSLPTQTNEFNPRSEKCGLGVSPSRAPFQDGGFCLYRRGFNRQRRVLHLTISVLPVGVPLSCRFFIRGEPPNKNKAVEYPMVEELVILITDARCENGNLRSMATNEIRSRDRNLHRWSYCLDRLGNNSH
jgi:hypothetical protein